MTSNPAIVRWPALAGPSLMLVYGVVRWIDGFDGDRGNGVAWNVGHIAFLLAMLLFAVLVVGVHGMVPARRRPAATIAAGAALFGIGCFLWVIVGDLSASFRTAYPLPEPLEAGGSMLFPLGVLVLLGLLVAARRLPVWSPLLFGAGIVAITVQLDLLPFASMAILAGLAPLASRPQPSRAPAHRL